MYFIAVVLPKHLDDKIVIHKKWMAERYGCKVGLKSPAHITLVAPFWIEEEKEKKLTEDIQAISAGMVSFALKTDNFSAFKPRTLFVSLVENENLKELKRSTDIFFQSDAYNIKTETRPFHPHITIASRDLHKKDFADAWPHFENKTFEEEFKVQGVSLLKHNGQRWDVIHTSAFPT